MILHIKATRTARQSELGGQLASIGARDGRRREHHQLALELQHLAELQILRLHKQVVRHRVLRDLRRATVNKADAHLARPVVELLIAFRRRADVHVKDSDIHVWVRLLQQQGVLDGVHAAKTGAVLVVTGIT